MTRKRNLVYLAIILAVLIAVVARQRAVTAERNQKIISSFSEWRENGKPVVVRTVKKKDVAVYTKVTFWQIAPHVFEAQVSREVRDQLSIGQTMQFRVDGLIFEGTIAEVAEEISLDTGMYPVRTEFDQTFDIPGWGVAYAHIQTIPDAISIPNEIIEKKGEKDFVWKVKSGTAVRQEIAIRQRDGYGAIVSRGVEEGDVIVVEGFTLLREGDNVNIQKESVEEKEHD
jgi:multidrug efflux pump subunit AcrA (membrane-fusion protein)